MSRACAIVIAATGLIGVALAQELPPFEEVDANSDGLITQSEASSVEGLDFVNADTNQDGALDRSEYAAAAGQ